MQLEMSISTEQWMDLMSYVVDNLDNVDSPLRPSNGFSEEAHLFFWERYCSLHKKVLSYLKTYEKSLFSEPSDMIQRILLHRTQEYDGLDARIGIPLAFKLKEVDTDATFTEDTAATVTLFFEQVQNCEYESNSRGPKR